MTPETITKLDFVNNKIENKTEILEQINHPPCKEFNGSWSLEGASNAATFPALSNNPRLAATTNFPSSYSAHYRHNYLDSLYKKLPVCLIRFVTDKLICLRSKI